MTAEESRKELALYRLKQADESLEEARFLEEGGKSLRSVANRIYYSMFYAILALLVFEKYASSKHSGVISYFNSRFVKDGIFDEEDGRAVNRAFELRQRGDYREYVEISEKQVELLLSKASVFVEKVKKYLEANRLI